MARLNADETCWPLAILSVKGCLTYEQHEVMIKIWEAWFDRQQPFISLRLHLDEAALTQSSGTARLTKEWLDKKGASQKMATLVAGMAIVVPETSYESSRHLSVEKVFKIPGGIFPNVQQSLNWVQQINYLTLPDRVKIEAQINQILSDFQNE